MEISKKNNLYEYLNENKKELLDLFNGNKDYLKTITSGNTNISISFKCDIKNCNNIYNTRARDITRKDGKNHKGKCNSCQRKRQGINYQKFMLEKNGNLFHKYNNIIDIWSDKNIFKPEQLTPQSHKSVYLKCPNKSRNHQDYNIKVYNIKHNQFNNCPKCVSHFSKCEVRIMTELIKLGIEVLHLSKINGREADLLLPELKLVIEVDGFPWHLNKEEKDLNKNKLFEHLGYNVIRIRDNKLNNIDCNKIICDVSNFCKNDFNNLLHFINENFIKEIKNIDGFDEKLYQKKYCECCNINYEDSIEYLFPESKDIWNYDKNIILPNKVKYGSSDKVWIKCINGHERYNKICDIFTKKGITKCKYCLEIIINGVKYSSMTDCCNKLNISRTSLCRKMKSLELNIKDPNVIKYFIETNY